MSLPSRTPLYININLFHNLPQLFTNLYSSMSCIDDKIYKSQLRCFVAFNFIVKNFVKQYNLNSYIITIMIMFNEKKYLKKCISLDEF